MSWYDSDWGFRVPFVLDFLTTPAAATDFTIALPTELQVLWDNIQSAGEDIRVTAADGRTLLTYDLNTVSSANRTGTIEIDNYTPPTDNAMICGWVYFGNAGASDASTPFAPAAARSGYIYPGCPQSRIIPSTPPQPEQTKPRSRVQKTSVESILVWFDVTDDLEIQCTPP